MLWIRCVLADPALTATTARPLIPPIARRCIRTHSIVLKIIITAVRNLNRSHPIRLTGKRGVSGAGSMLRGIRDEEIEKIQNTQWGNDDSIIIEGDSIEELQLLVRKETEKRGWKNCWSEEIK